MERTTITLSPPTRDRILELKRRLKLPSAEAVILRMMGAQPMGAKALYRAHKAQVDAVLRRHKVRNLVAFGSRARGDARPDRDLDLVGTLPKDADLITVAHVQAEL